MPSERRSLKFTLPVTFILAFAAVQLGLWLSVSLVIGRHLQARLDGDLLGHAQALVKLYETRAQEQPQSSSPQLMRDVTASMEGTGLYVLTYLRGANEYISTSNLRGIRFPYTPPGEHFVHPRFQTLRGKATQGLVAGSSLRVITLDPDVLNGYVQVGADLGPIEMLLSNVKRLILIFAVATLLIAALVSWLVTQRAVAPLAELSARVRGLSLADLGEPVRVPDTRDEVAEVATAFNTLIERLKREFRNQQSFVSNSAHELKTPLAVLLASVQNQKRQTAPAAPEHRFLVSVEEEVRRLLRTVESFLLLTRSHSGRGLEVVTDVFLEEAAISAIQACLPEARRREVQIVPVLDNTEGSFEPVVRGDADLLVTMLENLVANAVRHSPPGSRVEVATTATAKEARIAVRDEGPGIPPQHQSRIFDLFYQVDPHGESAGKAGIGLTIVKAVCELHGGVVNVANRPGGGCEFQVRLPARERATEISAA